MTDSTAPNNEEIKSLNLIVDAIGKAKHDWVLSVFERVMPPDVFEAARFADRKAWARKKVMHWCGEYLVEIRDFPDRSEVWGGKLIASFRVTTANGKLEFQEKIEPCQTTQKQ